MGRLPTPLEQSKMATPHQQTHQQIIELLNARFNPTRLEVENDSHRHAKHKEAKQHPKAGHFKVLLVSDAFVGKSLLQRHRLVYECLAELMDGAIHALALDTKTPGEDK
jgi:BolA protein